MTQIDPNASLMPSATNIYILEDMTPHHLHPYTLAKPKTMPQEILTSMILFPPIRLIRSVSSPSRSSFSTSSPPPILLPLISTFGTVPRPVLFCSESCSFLPMGCLSSSTTKGDGTMVYFSTRMAFAFFENGQ